MGADIAVYAFFALSGVFVMVSYFHRSSPCKFIVHRLKRLLPAYFAVVLAAAVILAVISSYSFADYFLSSDWWKYVVSNMCLMNFLSPNLPGVFSGHIETAVNGSLWYVKVEVLFTLFFPLLVWGAGIIQKIFRVRRSLFVPLIAVCWCVLSLTIEVYQMQGEGVSWTFVRYVHSLQMFLVGILFSAFIPLLKSWKNFFKLLFLILIIFGIFAAFSGIVGLPFPRFLISTAVVLILIRLFMVETPFSAMNRNNVSYSVYLCHFPLIQLAVELFPDSYRVPLIFLLIACVAPLLYFGVEKRCNK